MLHSKRVRPSPSLPGALGEGVPSDVVQLRVVLIEIVPPIWRRLRVPARLTLRRLHAVLQEAMGWKDLQPHRFRVGGLTIGKPSGPADPVKDSRWVSLQDLLDAGRMTFHYDYGVGDGWVHEIRVEARREGTTENQRAVCLEGDRSCPPDDSRGPDDYVELLAKTLPLVNRGPGIDTDAFDPDRFDLDAVNVALAALPR